MTRGFRRHTWDGGIVAKLEVEDLWVNYGAIQAVSGISLTLSPGEVLVVLGANGAGKSSTLRAIAGLIPSRGTVRWDGNDVSRFPAHRRSRAGLAMVPEGRRVFAPLTVEENLQLGSYTVRDGTRRKELLEQVLEIFPRLVERRTSPAGLLSGGEQQMLAIGRAMMASPRAILMDEPSMGLAPVIVDTVMDAISRIAGTGIGVLMVEQNALAALDVASRAVIVDRGRIVLEGDVERFRSDPAVLRTFLGSQAAE